MPNFPNKDERELIEQLNVTLGTRYRTTPFDMNKIEDIIEAVNMATAEYFDFVKYHSSTTDLEEKLDETIEVFYPHEWMKITLGEEMKNKKLQKVYSLLRQVSDLFRKIESEAETSLLNTWNYIIVSSPVEVNQYFFGKEFRLTKKLLRQMPEMLNDIWDCLNEHDGTVESSGKTFAQFIIHKYESSR